MDHNVFDTSKIPWIHNNNGKSKILLDKNILNSSSMRIFELDGHSKFETHEHNFTQIMYFPFHSIGKLILDEDKIYQLKEGLVVLVKPNQCHKIINESSNTLRLFVIESYSNNNDEIPFVDF